MAGNVRALLSTARTYLEGVEKERPPGGLSRDQRIELAKAYTLLAIATQLAGGDEPGSTSTEGQSNVRYWDEDGPHDVFT